MNTRSITKKCIKTEYKSKLPVELTAPQKLSFWGAIHIRVVLSIFLTPYFINMEVIFTATIYFKFCAVKIKYNCRICVIINSKHLLEVNREAKKMFSNFGN